MVTKKFKGGNFMKKIIIIVFLFVLLASFTGCGVKDTNTSPSNPVQVKQTKIVKIDSNPQGATVFIDNNNPITTPAEVEFSIGIHFITFRKEGYEGFVQKDFEVKEDTTSINVTLKKLPTTEEILKFGVLGPVAFDTVPHFACCSAAAIAYSNIFYGDTLTISGLTTLESFDFVFPSGKKVHFDTERTLSGVRKFSKVVTFDEVGGYEIISNGERKYFFEVCYKATVLPPTPKLEDLFPSCGIKNAIAVPIGKEVEARLLITDAKGNPIKNTSLGVYDLKTDNTGIVSFKARVVRTECEHCYAIYVNGKQADLTIYADLLIWGYDYAKFSKFGKLIESSMPQVKLDAKVVLDGGSVYMPYGSFGLKLNEIFLGSGIGGDVIISHPKNPSIIYTNSFVSKDGGEHFEKLGMSLNTIALHPDMQEMVFGWSVNSPNDFLQSTDYGLHFEKIGNVRINLANNFVEQIVVDPKNPERIYLATSKWLYRSEDGGKTFNPIIQNELVKFIAINPRDSNIIFVSSERGILKSEDSGKTWNIVKNNTNGNMVNCIVFDPKNVNTVYTGSYYEFSVSKDSGKTWEKIGEFLIDNNGSIAVNPLKHNIVYVVSFRDGIYKSEDYGKHFAKIDSPVGDVSSIAFDSKGELLFIDNGVPFKMNEKGNFLPLRGDMFLVGGPEWKIIDGKFFIDVSGVNTSGVKAVVGGNYMDIYKVCDMLP